MVPSVRPTKTSPLPPPPDTVPLQRPDIKFENSSLTVLLTIHGNESTITVFLGLITIRTIPCQPRTAHGRRTRHASKIQNPGMNQSPFLITM